MTMMTMFTVQHLVGFLLGGDIGVTAVYDDDEGGKQSHPGLHHDDHDEHLLWELLGDSLAGHVGMFASIPDDDEEQ